MTLKEKLKTNISINTNGEAGRFADQCEKIAEEFAIEFAEWLNGLDINDEVLQKHISTKELLEIYKKENYENI